MKILFGIQGTGNGHLTRAMDIIPALEKHGNVDILVSGCQVDLSLPWEVKYRRKGISFIFGKNGGIDFQNTFAQLDSRSFYQDVHQLPVMEYDLVISDFEPITAWACRKADKPCIGLSNQCALLLPGVPKAPETDRVGTFVLRNYAPTSANYGFHFAQFNSKTFTPIIRQEVRNAPVSNSGHYTVYLPAYEDEKLIRKLSQFPEVRWEVFSKHSLHAYEAGNIIFRPVQNREFLTSMASSAGVICAAGFGTPSEALFMGKKLLVIPMKNQYEQACNTAALNQLGVPSVKNLKKKSLAKIRKWLESGEAVQVVYPDQTQSIVDTIISNHLN